MSARNRELLALIPASLLLTAGFAAIFIQESDVLSNVSLTYGALQIEPTNSGCRHTPCLAWDENSWRMGS